MSTKKLQRILITAGGTGGHVFPGLVVAKAFRDQGVEVRWVGTRQGIESRVVPSHDIAIDYLDIEGVRGQGLKRLLLAPLKIAWGVLRAMSIIRDFRPDAVLGMGGFVTGPTGLAAWLSGRPLLIHEQNAIAGLTNRILSTLSRRVLQAFPTAFSASAKVETTGNPVRQEIVQLPAPEQRYSNRTGSLRILVLGGSQGAVSLNQTVPQAFAQLQAKLDFVVRHQAGPQNIEAAKALYQQAGVEADVVPFIEDMAAAYGWADLVICRSGALTVSELAAAGVASLLIPYPHAVDDHQTRNGEYLSQQGAAMLVQQQQITPMALAQLIQNSFSDRARLQIMATKARALAMLDATGKVVRACQEVVGGN